MSVVMIIKNDDILGLVLIARAPLGAVRAGVQLVACVACVVDSKLLGHCSVKFLLSWRGLLETWAEGHGGERPRPAGEQRQGQQQQAQSRAPTWMHAKFSA